MLRHARSIGWILALVLVTTGCGGTGKPPRTDDPEEFVAEMEAQLFNLFF